MRTKSRSSQNKSEQEADAIQSISAGFDMVTDHVVITDADASVVYVNEAALAKTGFSRSEVIGKNPGVLWGGHMPTEMYKDMWDTIKNKKKTWVGEVQNRKKDGTLYWQQLRVNPVLDSGGEVIYFVGIEPDITSIRNKARKLKNKLVEIKAMDKFMDGRQQKIAELEEAINKLKAELNS